MAKMSEEMKDGREARRDGKGRHACPQGLTPEQRDEWQAGWSSQDSELSK